MYLNRHTPSGQSRVYPVTQLRTDGVHCRESVGTGPVNLKVVPITGAALAGHHGPINMRLPSHSVLAVRVRRLSYTDMTSQSCNSCSRFLLFCFYFHLFLFYLRFHFLLFRFRFHFLKFRFRFHFLFFSFPFPSCL